MDEFANSWEGKNMMDFLTYGIIMGGMVMILFLMYWSYLLGKYYERATSNHWGSS